MEDTSRDKYAEFMPLIVKSAKELIILSMLLEYPMSGYDLIKKIMIKTNVLLSQGTVYPILCLFEEADILQATYRKGDMRTKLDHLTPQGREIAQDKIDHFVQALNYFITLIDAEATYPSSCDIKNDPALDLRSDSDLDKSGEHYEADPLASLL